MARRENREEEVLEDASLCDLPVLNTCPSKEEGGEKTNKKLIKKKKNNEPSISNDVVSEPQEEFAFGSANGSSTSLCAAEDVFFRGRILPLRPSLTSDVWTPLGPEPNRIPARSRSESMDRAISRAGFRSISSRSAHKEEAPIAVARVASEPRHRARNRFHAHPSPKPHVRASRPRSSGIERVSSVKAKHKSSMWDFFRVGLVRAPELELQEQKAVISLRSNSRVHKGSTNSNPMSRSSSGSNSDNSANNHHSNKTSSSPRSREGRGLGTVENNKQNRMKFLSGCTCTAESVASDIAVVVKTKGTGGCTDNINTGDDFNIVTTKLEEVLLLENPRSIKEKSENSGRSDDDYYYYYRDDQKLIEKQSSKEEGRRRRNKQAVSHHRTYEWLKELSHANLPMHV